MEDLTREMPCVGRACDYNLTKSSANCSSGSGSCFAAMMVRIHENDYHDAVLAKATEAINEILTKIGNDSKGRELSMLATPWGALLAWVEHGAKIPHDAVGHDCDPAELAAVIGLKDTSSATAAD